MLIQKEYSEDTLEPIVLVQFLAWRRSAEMVWPQYSAVRTR